MADLYYQAPTENIFQEVLKGSIEIWKTYDNEFGYADEKIDAIKNLINISDNVMYIIAMFDPSNQHKLFKKLSDESKKEIYKRMVAGGTPIYLIDEILRGGEIK